MRGEKAFPVPPLGLPELKRLPSLETLSQYAAVELFIARTLDAKIDFAVTKDNALAVAELCHRLDGLPLAIELAAARIALFSPLELLERLDQRLMILTTGTVDLPTRQQTLRRALAWSYDLLDEGEQRLFRRLGVFVGGCTLEAAAAVCNTADDLGLDVMEGVTALCHNSLLQRMEGADGWSRFTMLETIREYALERLVAHGEAEAMRQQHAAYYRRLCEVEWPDEETWLRRMAPEYDNLCSALAWSQTTAGDPEVALQIVGGLVGLWSHRGTPREAIAALERTLNHPRGVGQTAALAAVRSNLAIYYGLMGNYAAARSQLEQALSLAREVGDTERYARVLHRLGWLAREQGDSATAWTRMTESLAISRRLGDTQDTAWTLLMMAEVAILEEEPAQAEVLLTESRALGQQSESTIGWWLNHLGHAAQLRGDYQRAAQLHQESLDLFQSIGDQSYGVTSYGLAAAYQSLGETALGLEHLGEAAGWLAQGLAFSKTLGYQSCMAWCLAGLGSVAALADKPERAARLWGAAEALRQTVGLRPPPAARTTYERAQIVARAKLGEAVFATMWAAGQALTLEQAIAYALGGDD